MIKTDEALKMCSQQTYLAKSKGNGPPVFFNSVAQSPPSTYSITMHKYFCNTNVKIFRQEYVHKGSKCKSNGTESNSNLKMES